MQKDARSLSFKIFLSFIVIILAFAFAWYTTRSNTIAIRNTIQQLTKPNSANILSNQLFKKLVALDQLERQHADFANNVNLEIKIDSLRLDIDTILIELKRLYQDNDTLLERVLMIDTTLHRRDALMKEYTLFTARYRKSDSLQFVLDKFSSFVKDNYLNGIDSIFKKYNTIAATTDTIITKVEEPASSSFWQRVFGKKREPHITEIQHFILEQLNVSLDTLKLLRDDSIYTQLTRKINESQSYRLQQRSALGHKRISLLQTNTLLFEEVLSHVEQLEEIERQLFYTTNLSANKTISNALNEMSYLLWTFGIIIFILAILIIIDLINSNKYKIALQDAKLKAEQESQAKQEFLSNMSHEMRSPLQSIIGYTELLQNDNTIGHIQSFKVIKESSKHLLDVLNHYLDFYATNQRLIHLDKKTFLLSTLLDEVHSIIAIQVEDKKLKLHWSVDNVLNDTFIIADPFRIKQVVLNVLHNAVKYTSKGSITMKAKAVLHHSTMLLNIEIADTGVGIPEDKLETIFLPYHQVEHHEESTGLGLAIVKQIIDAYQGEVKVSSQLGQGTIFYISLPLDRQLQPLENITTDNIPQLHSSYTQQLIWVLDDDVTILEYYNKTLQQLQLNFRLFQHPETLLMQEVPDNLGLVLMDIRMPQMNGYEVLQLLNSKLVGMHAITFVAVTGQVLSHEIDKAINAGFHDVLQKPFNQPQLVALINRYLSQDVNQTSNLSNKDQDEILQLVIDAVVKDLPYIDTALQQGDVSTLHYYFHMHASRWGQAQQEDIAQRARSIETKLKNNTLPLIAIQQYITSIEKRFKV